MDLDLYVKQIRNFTDFVPEVGIVLGSGLSGIVKNVDIVARVNYASIKGFPNATVEGHHGEYIFGYLNKKPVVLMNGRVHLYEGYEPQEVVIPVVVMAALGAKNIFLTNASGGLNENFRIGTLMCIVDQISSFVPSPLRGKNDDRLGPRFPDMTQIYSPTLIAKLQEVAHENNIKIAHGVYVQVPGPAFETIAEARLYQKLGGDAVGMSTAIEALMLHYMGVNTLGISVVTDMAIHNNSEVTTHEEVQKNANIASENLIKLITGVIDKL